MVSKIVADAQKQYEQALAWRGKGNPEHGVIINRDTCIASRGCRNCINFCPGDLIYFSNGKPEVKFQDECWFCGICAQVCGPKAIAYIFPEQILKASERLKEERARASK